MSCPTSYVISGWNLEPCLTVEATAWALREMAKWTKEKRHIGRFGREAQELAAKFMERQPHQSKKRKLQQVEEPISQFLGKGGEGIRWIIKHQVKQIRYCPDVWRVQPMQISSILNYIELCHDISDRKIHTKRFDCRIKGLRERRKEEREETLMLWRLSMNRLNRRISRWRCLRRHWWTQSRYGHWSSLRRRHGSRRQCTLRKPRLIWILSSTLCHCDALDCYWKLGKSPDAKVKI